MAPFEVPNVDRAGAAREAGSCEDRGAVIRLWAVRLPTATACSLAPRPLEHPADAIMAGGIVGALVTVSCADGGTGHADGCGCGARLAALREVGETVAGAADNATWPWSAQQAAQLRHVLP